MKPFQFLKNLRPSGPWILSSVHPETNVMKTRACASEENVEEFLSTYHDCNLYYSLNPVIRPEDKKAERKNIAAVEYLHVDLDPRAGEPLEEEHDRIERLLANLPTGIPQPTVVIFSGGGYNLLWKLEDPIEINGNVETAEEVKLYNLRLESVLGGDNCHNIDRILRLPGTTNWPNAKKRKRGRTPTESKIVSFQPELVYPIASFQKAHLVSKHAGPKPKIEVSGNIARIPEDKLDTLGVDLRVQNLILHGKDPDEPHRYASRSEALFAVVIALVRAGRTDEEIYALITDPDYGIAESVIEAGSSMERYALRQIERARELAIDPNLMELNDKYAVIENVGGKVRVVRFVEDAVTGHVRPQRFTFEDFRKALMNQRIEVQQGERVRFIPKGDWWLENPNRRQYEQMVFAPGREVRRALNLWRGFRYEAKPPAPGEEGKHASFLLHVRDNICRGVEEHYEYLVNWMARAVQQPDAPGYSAIVLKGGQGTGKGVFAREFGNLFGPHFKHVSDGSRVSGKHNLHLQDAVVLFADEAFFAGDKQHAAALKRLITESTLDIEAKYHDAEITPNFLHIIMASNEDWVIPADLDDRRFFVLEVGDDAKQDGKYFRGVCNDLKHGGYENLLFFLQARDLTGFDVSKIPQTAALREQKLRSMTPLQEWWYEKLDRGYVLDEHGRWEEEVPVDTLLSDFKEYLDGTNRRYARAETATSMRKFLEQITQGRVDRKRMAKAMVVLVRGKAVSKEKPYAFVLPELSVCRASFDKIAKTETTWDDE